jgi:hypothetical protein
MLEQNLQSIGMLDETKAETIDQAVKAKLKQAMAFSEASPEPDSDELYTDLFSPSLFTQEQINNERGIRQRIRNDPGIRVISYAQALAEAMREEMKRDPRVFVLGEDVGLYGGAYGATRDLWKEFGDLRVIDTPISEATIGG